LKLDAGSTQKYEGPFVFVMGCAGTPTITDAASFDSTATEKFVGNTDLTVDWSMVNPSISNPNCVLTKNELVELDGSTLSAKIDQSACGT
jgi:hypothetical protein